METRWDFLFLAACSQACNVCLSVNFALFKLFWSTLNPNPWWWWCSCPLQKVCTTFLNLRWQQTFTEISFLLLPGLRLTGFVSKPAGEDRKQAGLLWLGLLGTYTQMCLQTALWLQGSEHGWCHRGKGRKMISAVELLICAHKLITHGPACSQFYIAFGLRQLISGQLSHPPNEWTTMDTDHSPLCTLD